MEALFGVCKVMMSDNLSIVNDENNFTLDRDGVMIYYIGRYSIYELSQVQKQP